MRKLYMKNEVGMVKECPIGFSWLVLIFSFIVPLSNKDNKYTFIMFFIDILTFILTSGIGTIIARIVFGCMYNKWYINDLIYDKYEPVDDESKRLLNAMGLYIK